jgi:hypothetical protein
VIDLEIVDSQKLLVGLVLLGHQVVLHVLVPLREVHIVILFLVCQVRQLSLQALVFLREVLEELVLLVDAVSVILRLFVALMVLHLKGLSV